MTIIEPEITSLLLPATHQVQNEAQKVLFVGQMTSAGTATSGNLYTKIGNNNEQDALFGKNSMLATMIRAAKYHNKVSRFDAIPLADNGAGVQAAGAVAFSGTASAAGTITVSIGSTGNISELAHVYEVGIANLETATAIGAALAAAINADTFSPVTAVNTTGSVAITAIHKGTEGNFISIEVSGTVAGVTYTLTGMTGGATNPVLTGLFDVAGTTRYQTVLYPHYIKSTAKTFLDARFNVNKRILDGIGISATCDTAANIETELLTDNSQNIAVIPLNKIATPLVFFVGNKRFEIPTIVAAQCAAIRALRLTDGANISQYVNATYGAKDAFGGMHIASLPYFNTKVPTLSLNTPGNDFSDTELDDLKAAGAWLLGENDSKTSVIFGTVETTYKKDGSGNDDVSFKFLEYVDTDVTCREYFTINLRERFANSRLGGGVIIGFNNATEEIIKAEIIGLYKNLCALNLCRIGVDQETGADLLTYFENNLSVVLDYALGLATITMLLPVVTQLRIIRLTIQPSFSATN